MGVIAPAKQLYKDLLTGDSRDFTGSLGAWTNSGGTLTRDTAYQITGMTASAKFVATANTHYMEVTVPGTFLAGVDYVAIVYVSLEETTGTHALRLLFGLIGTDVAPESTWAFASDADIPMVGDGKFQAAYIKWKPTANRTGVKLRLANNAAITSTWHVGLARVFRPASSDFYGGPPITTDPNNQHLILPLEGGFGYLNPWSGSGGGISWNYNGDVGIFEATGVAGLATGSSIGEPEFTVYLQGPHTAGDLADNGIEIGVGSDYVGLYISEKDSNTVQFAADASGGYMMQLRNRGSGKGWAVSDDGTVNQKITDTFQWAFYVSGAQTTGNDKAAYFQVPEKCRIDEVRIHLGTAPTGSSFIVDVNDDGTTIFTTQGNRPAIADGANDDTSGTPDGGTSVAKDSVLTIDVDQIGSGTAGSDLVVFVRGRFIW